jgi:hypothetical protein
MGLGIAKPKETGWQKKTKGETFLLLILGWGFDKQAYLTECRRPKGLLYLILYSFASLSHNLKGFIHYSLRS